MNPRSLTLGLALLVSAVGCRSVESSTVDFEVAAASGYVFRGLHMNDGIGTEVSGVADLNRGDGSTLAVYAWGYLDVTGDAGKAALESGNDLRFSRLDLGAVWAKSYTDWALSFGMASYNFPNAPVATTGTSEVFATAERIDKWYRPRGAFYYDFQNADDFYLRLGTHPRYEFDRALFGDIGVDVGVMGSGQQRFYYGDDGTGAGYSNALSDLLLTTGLTYVQDENFRAFLRFGVAAVLSSDLKTQNDANSIDNTIGWLSVGCGWTY